MELAEFLTTTSVTIMKTAKVITTLILIGLIVFGVLGGTTI